MEFRNTVLGRFGGVGPRSGVFGGVFGGKGKSAEGDAKVEVGEDKLDAMVLYWFNLGLLSSVRIEFGSETYVGRSKVAYGI